MMATPVKAAGGAGAAKPPRAPAAPKHVFTSEQVADFKEVFLEVDTVGAARRAITPCRQQHEAALPLLSLQKNLSLRLALQLALSPSLSRRTAPAASTGTSCASSSPSAASRFRTRSSANCSRTRTRTRAALLRYGAPRARSFLLSTPCSPADPIAEAPPPPLLPSVRAVCGVPQPDAQAAERAK